MSKEKLIELTNASDFDLTYWLAETPVDEVRKTFIMALKEQSRDTRHGCAEECLKKGPQADNLTIIPEACHDICMNYRDKSLDYL